MGAGVCPHRVAAVGLHERHTNGRLVRRVFYWRKLFRSVDAVIRRVVEAGGIDRGRARWRRYIAAVMMFVGTRPPEVRVVRRGVPVRSAGTADFLVRRARAVISVR
ncbi:hypothetical protein A9W95_19325 [Mycobacterium sp. 1423905.2]|nr:hypothetical protein A9W95_19325 [Mycobacterium sp. 1423905.2]